MKLKVTVNGTEYVIDVEVEEEQQPSLGAIVIGGSGPTPTAPTTAKMPATSSKAVVAPLAGSVARIQVKEGDQITAGQVLVVLEAMKMETEITAPRAGKVLRILVEKGDAVAGGEGLIELD